jgi:hypothetical protein
LVAGTKINQAEILFTKIDDDFVDIEVQNSKKNQNKLLNFLQ